VALDETWRQRAERRRAQTDAVLTATVERLLCEVGYPNVTIERVARESRVAKSTIYRRWATKADMVSGIIAQRAEPVPEPAPARGREDNRLRDGLRAAAGQSIDFLSSDLARAVLPGLLADAIANPVLAETMRQQFAEGGGQLRGVLMAAIERGEIRPDVDVDGAQSILMGTAFAAVCLLGRTDRANVEELLVDQVLALVGFRPAARAPKL
jgi:AcrR family transcriptional regulator